MRAKVVIRPAVASDAATIHAALLGLAEATGDREKIKSTVEDIHRHGFGERPAFETLIAESGGVFAGLSLFFPSFSTWFGKPGLYVQDLFVAPAFRGQGIADLLMRETARLARARGATYLRLSVDRANEPARRFYQRIGMKWSEPELIFVARHADFDALYEPPDEQA